VRIFCRFDLAFEIQERKKEKREREREREREGGGERDDVREGAGRKI